MRALENSPNQASPAKALLLRLIWGTVFSLMLAAFVVISARYLGVNFATVPPQDLLAMITIFVWADMGLMFLVSRLPTYAVVILSIVIFSFTAASLYFFLMGLMHLH